MKTRTQPIPNFAAALILGSLLGSGASAQDADQDRPRINNPTDTVVSVNFAGGTLAELVDVIRESDEYINILTPPEASQVSAPSLSLKQVSVGNALRAIAQVCSNRQASVDVTAQNTGWGQPVFSLRVALARQRETAAPGSVETSVVVFSIRSMTESLPGVPEDAQITFAADTILTAIDTGLNVADPEGDKAQIRYHADSGLLFVRGTWEQNQLIESVLESMENDLNRRRGAARASRGGR
jgi:hypothetical protein